MKKITFFATLLAMLVSSVQSAFADDAKWTNKFIKSVADATADLGSLENGYYLIENVGHNSFAHVANNGVIWLDGSAANPDGIDNICSRFVGTTDKMHYVFYLSKNDDNATYTIQAKSGKFFPQSLPHGGGASVNATAGKYTIEKISDGNFSLKSEVKTTWKENGKDVEGILYADGNGTGHYSTGTFTGWSTTQPGAGSNGDYKFFKVEVGEIVTANFKYTVNGHVVLAASKQVVPNTTLSADNYPLLTINSYSPTTIETTQDVTVDCNMALPVEASTAAAPKWYAVRFHTGKRMMVADAANSEVACNDVESSLPEQLPDANQWAFVGGDLFTSFKLYNKGTQKYLKTSAKDAISTLVDEADASEFHVMATQVKDMDKGFCISNGSWYLNFQNPNTGTKDAPKYDKPGVYGWHDNDQGSTCTVYAPESFPLNYAASFINVPEGAIGGPQYLETGANLNALKTAYNAVEAGATDENVQKLVDINKQIAASSVGTTLTEGYYRLVNRQYNQYLHINGNNMNLQNGKEKAIGSVVYFKSVGDNQYSMMIEGKYLGKVTKSNAINLVDEADKGTFSVTSSNFITLLQDVSVENEKNFHYIHVNGSALGWEASAPASQWYAIPATDVEIDMTAQGNNTYASAYLPFSVSAVDGATAYVGALNADKTAIDMKGVSGVPANIGFVLVGNGSKATLTIGNAAAIEGENALTGTNTGIQLTSGENDNHASYLVFGVNDNKVGFYKPASTLTSIAANKAFINASEISNQAIALNFGNTVTGINAATLVKGENNAPIYDLSGRRVWAPVKGGLYIQNGKKLVK